MKSIIIFLVCLLGVVNAAFAASTTWDAAPSAPTTPGAALNCNKWYTVKKGDTCYFVVTVFKIPMKDFNQWNPAVSSDCKDNFWADTSYCVGVGDLPPTKPSPEPPVQTSTPSSSSSTSTNSPTVSQTTTSSYSFIHPIPTWNVTTTPVETAMPPKKTQKDQASNCIRWHLVEPGDTCESIAGRWRALEWNPSLKDMCNFPWIGWYVCIGVGPKTTSARPTGPVSGPPRITYPTTPPPIQTINFTTTTTYVPPPFDVPLPTQAGFAPGCQLYHRAGKGDTCDSIVKAYNDHMTDKLFHEWNPSLGLDCKGMTPGYCYCIAAYSAGYWPPPPTVTMPPDAISKGTTDRCTRWYLRASGESCDDISLSFGSFSVKEFLDWNFGLEGKCDAIMVGTWYCVGVPDTPTSRIFPVPTSLLPPPLSFPSSTAGPTDPSIPAPSIPAPSIPEPTIPEPTTSVTKVTTTTTKTVTGRPNPPTTSSSGDSDPVKTTICNGDCIPTPTPIQDGMVAGCHRFYLVKKGDSCWSITQKNNIPLSDFIKWNPNVGKGCENLWADRYVCIATGGPIMTITA
ncbi:hypothetical protein FE257_010380 [Aspergillus nanangensis]|uniref:LysM domain-containing protein n=1 Tax=Aspergillus nanangensis TaxID=2582783 RepID=A0AAD4CKH0_ASPNN|nr:hypothetical protein FE257_010380 [Aspergillus nanangensis]